MGEVLIVGAGPAGLTLAIELMRRRVPVRLIEAEGEPFEGSRGKSVQPRSLEIFDMMGFAHRLAPHRILEPRQKLHIGPFAFIPDKGSLHASPSEASPYPNIWTVAQWRTENLLRVHLEALGGRVEYGVALESLTQGVTHVHVVLTSGETLRPIYVAGCDGRRSVTREAVGLSLGAEAGDGGTIMADVAINGLDTGFRHVWPLHRGGPVSLAPLPEFGLFQLQAPEALAAKGLERGVKRQLGLTVTRVPWQARYRRMTERVERYREGRVFFVGEAAHRHPPTNIGGLNREVQDAWNLGWKLVSAIRTGDPAILDTYESERRSSPLRADKLEAQFAYPGTSRTDPISAGYRSGPLARGRPQGTLFAGDRMPDIRLADGLRLFEVMRHGGATLLIQRDGRHALVRPDGYIAAFTDRTPGAYHGHSVKPVTAAA